MRRLLHKLRGLRSCRVSEIPHAGANALPSSATLILNIVQEQQRIERGSNQPQKALKIRCEKHINKAFKEAVHAGFAFRYNYCVCQLSFLIWTAS